MDALRDEFTYFLTVIETRNISHAATRLGLQQPTVTRAIQRLESESGEKLFIRKRDGVELTTQGQNLYREVLKLKEIWSKRDLSSESNSVTGMYRIGMHASVASSYLPNTIDQIFTDNRKLQLDFVFSNSRDVVRKVIKHEIDFGIAVNPFRYDSLVIIPLLKEPICLLQLKKNNKKSEQLYFHPEMIDIQKLLKKYKTAVLRPIPDYEVLAAVAQQSSGYALLPKGVAVRNKLDSLIIEESSEGTISFIHHIDRPLNNSGKYILGLLKNQIKHS